MQVYGGIHGHGQAAQGQRIRAGRSGGHSAWEAPMHGCTGAMCDTRAACTVSHAMGDVRSSPNGSNLYMTCNISNVPFHLSSFPISFRQYSCLRHCVPHAR